MADQHANYIAAAFSVLHSVVYLGEIGMRNSIVAIIATLWLGMSLAAVPKQVVLDVENMTCAACSITIEQALKKVPGVTGQRIDAKSSTVVVTYDPARTSIAIVSRAVTNAGFPAKARLPRD